MYQTLISWLVNKNDNTENTENTHIGHLSERVIGFNLPYVNDRRGYNKFGQ